MKIQLIKEEIDKRLVEMGHDEITIDYQTFTNVNTKCRFIDREYGEWWAIPSNILHRKSRHPKRGHGIGGKKRAINIEEIKTRLFDIFGDLVKIDESTYINGRTKARFIDKEYGEFWQRVDAVIFNKSLGHPMRGHLRKGKSFLVSFNTAQKRVRDIWGDEIELLESNYKQFSQKAKFKHKIYGVWEADPRSVIKGHNHPLAGIKKQKETMIEKYGVEHCSQNRQIRLKTARSLNRSVSVKHWKTNEEIICTASYEYAVINKLNELKVDYVTQIPFDAHIDDKKRVYYIDLYLPEKDIYVEIKGWFIGASKLKWEEFHSLHENSELWQLKEVKQFTNKTEYRITKDFKEALKNANNS